MGFRGGGQIDPPQRILVLKYPGGDRVKNHIYIKTKQDIISMLVIFHINMKNNHNNDDTDI